MVFRTIIKLRRLNALVMTDAKLPYQYALIHGLDMAKIDSAGVLISSVSNE